MPPYEICRMSKKNETKASLEGNDHFAFLLLLEEVIFMSERGPETQAKQ